MGESRDEKLRRLTRDLARGRLKTAREFFADGKRSASGQPRQPQTAAETPPSLPLGEACSGAEHRIATPLGEMPCWLVRRRLAELSPDDLAAQSDYVSVLRGARQRFDEIEAPAALCHVADGGPEDVLFMDTETCGFSGCPIFLVGVMFCRNGQLIFEQFLARDYAEEPPILQAFADHLASHRVLVTFNGKSYDMNMIRDRSVFHGLSLPEEPPHLDLLHASRRRWKRDLPNCRLQTLERFICGRRRQGDIPGSQIPDAYHQFVQTADASAVRDILHHNLLDLLTMVELLTALLTNTQRDTP
ncbi:MAG: hypothetical protein GVY16_10450 [Planctomycetes bacterium]|nr:ribonuclease H-like domain-containing protein [Phycisphaerae bacterium]NBB96142.1 hypothetical protein [Planctomycetota bacterium]